MLLLLLSAKQPKKMCKICNFILFPVDFREVSQNMFFPWEIESFAKQFPKN